MTRSQWDRPPIMLEDMPWAVNGATRARYWSSCNLYSDGIMYGTAYRFTEEWRDKSSDRTSATALFGIYRYDIERMDYYSCALEFMCAVQSFTLEGN